MGNIGKIFGCIYGGGPIGAPTFIDCFNHNQTVIAELPEKIDWQEKKFIIRSLFTVPMSPQDSFYRIQMIHFAASYQSLDMHLENWILGFENLLKNLFWFEAYIYMEAEMFQSHTAYHWKADIAPMFKTPPETIQTWTFTGGPRKLWDD